MKALFDGQLATGKYVVLPGKSSCPSGYASTSTPPQTGRTMSVSSSDDESTSFLKKRRRKEKNEHSSPHLMIAKAVAALTQVMTTNSSNQHIETEEKLTVAKILERECSDIIPIEDLIIALGVLEKTSKSEIFLSLQPGSLRDHWLKKEISNTKAMSRSIVNDFEP